MSAIKTKAERISEGLTVYVDPMAGYVYLKVVTAETGPLRIVVSDQMGNELMEHTIPVNQLSSIPLNTLTPGFYNVKVFLSNALLTEVFRF